MFGRGQKINMDNKTLDEIASKLESDDADLRTWQNVLVNFVESVWQSRHVLHKLEDKKVVNLLMELQ
jgi:hypothetical protein